MPELRPDENPFAAPEPVDGGRIAKRLLLMFLALFGAILGAISLAQILSGLGFPIDVFAASGTRFRMIGSWAGMILGLPLGGLAGVRIASGYAVRWKIVAIGGILGLAIYLVGYALADAHPMRWLLPIVGTVCGAILAGMLSLFRSTGKVDQGQEALPS